jgi:hypothetical protein
VQGVVSDGEQGRRKNGKACPDQCEGTFSVLRNRRSRRVLALFLVVLGGVLMYLAPEVWGGLAVLVLGVVVELAGIALERKV